MLISSPIAGFKRANLDADPEQQLEKDALFTIGRLVRSKQMSFYTYGELMVENWRGGTGRNDLVNALTRCEFEHCPAAVERSKFRTTINMDEWLAKGGNGDRNKGKLLSDFNQIPFFEWLKRLSREEVELLSKNASTLKLSGFEISSLRDLRWFQTLTDILNGPENLPDCFHIWTARRNQLDAVLTLEKKLPKTIKRYEMRRKQPIEIKPSVIRPTKLLKMFGIDNIDPVPVKSGRFYSYMEVLSIHNKLVSS